MSSSSQQPGGSNGVGPGHVSSAVRHPTPTGTSGTSAGWARVSEGTVGDGHSALFGSKHGRGGLAARKCNIAPGDVQMLAIGGSQQASHARADRH